MKLIIKIAVTGAAFWLVSSLLSGIEIGEEGDSVGRQILTYAVIAVIFGVVNAVLKPIVQVLGCGFYIITLGLFGLIVNALLFLLVAWLAELFGLRFEVGFWWAMLGAVLVTVTTWLINMLLPDKVVDRPGNPG